MVVLRLTALLNNGSVLDVDHVSCVGVGLDDHVVCVGVCIGSFSHVQSFELPCERDIFIRGVGVAFLLLKLKLASQSPSMDLGVFLLASQSPNMDLGVFFSG